MESAAPASDIEKNSAIFLEVSEHVEWKPVSVINGNVFLSLEPFFSIDA